MGASKRRPDHDDPTAWLKEMIDELTPPRRSAVVEKPQQQSKLKKAARRIASAVVALTKRQEHKRAKTAQIQTVLDVLRRPPANTNHDNEKTPLQLLIADNFPRGTRFQAAALKIAGRQVANDNAAGAIQTLAQNPLVGDGKAPVTAAVLWSTKPIEELAVMKAAASIQKAVYAMTRAEVVALKKCTARDTLDQAIAMHRLRISGVDGVQQLNAIIQHACATYLGVEVKVDNRNDKREKRWKRECERAAWRGEKKPEKPEVETAYDDRAYLLDPPGVNRRIQCVQQNRMQAYSPERFPELAEAFSKYSYQDPTAEIPSPLAVDRLKIRKGEPGWVPPHDRRKLSRDRHRRLRLSKSQKEAMALPVCISLPDGKGGSDIVAFDGRAMLRICRRKRIEVNSMDDVVAMFTGDPRIQLGYGDAPEVTCMLKPEHTGVIQTKLIKGKTDQHLLRLTQDGPIAMLAVDLGETNPAACAVYRVWQRAGLYKERLEAFTLPDEILGEFEAYRRASDEHTQKILDEAMSALTARQRAEVDTWQAFGPTLAAKNICERHGIRSKDIDWDAMTPHTTLIAEHLIARGAPESVTHVTVTKGKKTRKLIKYDSRFASDERKEIQLSKRTRDAWNKQIRTLQRASSNYRRLSVWKRQIARTAVNVSLHRTKKRAQCESIVVVVEDLNVLLMDGRGRRKNTWAGFFAPKSEKRWFIKAFHKVYTDLPANRGITVIEINPERTSITCTECGRVDKANRTGEHFECVECGHVANADLDIATENIARVALAGQRMPKAEKKP